MKLALVGPGIMTIPPDGWGAVESLIWDYALELEELGHEGTIVNTPNADEIIQYLNEDTYDFAHVHYDVFYPIMDRIAAETDIPKLAISSHYPYIDQPHMHRRDGYDRVFDWILKTSVIIFSASLKKIMKRLRMLVQMKVDFSYQRMVQTINDLPIVVKQ